MKQSLVTKTSVHSKLSVFKVTYSSNLQKPGITQNFKKYYRKNPIIAVKNPHKGSYSNTAREMNTLPACYMPPYSNPHCSNGIFTTPYIYYSPALFQINGMSTPFFPQVLGRKLPIFSPCSEDMFPHYQNTLLFMYAIYEI